MKIILDGEEATEYIELRNIENKYNELIEDIEDIVEIEYNNDGNLLTHATAKTAIINYAKLYDILNLSDETIKMIEN